MSNLREHLKLREQAFGTNVHTAFMIKYAKTYPVGPDSYAGPRAEPKMCYQNATQLALWNRDLTYVEGYVLVYGIPIEHAWLVDANGFVVDPTLANPEDRRIGEYFGVPFERRYLQLATLRNENFGLLDYFYAGQTAPKLYELGLEAGQQWLFDQPRPAYPSKKRRRKAA